MYEDTIDDTVTEPVNLTELKSYLSLIEDGRVDDAYLLSLAASARSMLEEGVLDCVIAARTFEASASADQACLPVQLHAPLLSVDSVTYRRIDPDTGEEGEGTVEDYTVHRHPEYPCVTIDKWPEDALGDVTVTYTSGMERVPPAIIQAIKMMCLSLYRRDETSPLTAEVKALVSPYVRYHVCRPGPSEWSTWPTWRNSPGT